MSTWPHAFPSFSSSPGFSPALTPDGSSCGSAPGFDLGQVSQATDWFREPFHFSFMQERLKQNLMGGVHSPVHILSVGCADGKECICAAIALEDCYFDLESNGFEFPVYHIVGIEKHKETSELAKRNTRENLKSFLPTSFHQYKSRAIDAQTQAKREERMKSNIEIINEDFCKIDEFKTTLFDFVFFRYVLVHQENDGRINSIKKISSVLKKHSGVLFVGQTEEHLLREMPEFCYLDYPGTFKRV